MKQTVLFSALVSCCLSMNAAAIEDCEKEFQDNRGKMKPWEESA